MGWLAGLAGGPLGWLAAPLGKVLWWLGVALFVFLCLIGLEKYVSNKGKLKAAVEGLEGAIKTIETRKRIERRAKEMTDEEIDQWLTPPSQRRKR
jgi:hypothetical protein